MTFQTTTSKTDSVSLPFTGFVRYTFFKLDQAWRHLAPQEQSSIKAEFIRHLDERGRLVSCRTYSLVGTRADTDFMLWTMSDSLDKFQEFHSQTIRTGLGRFLSTPYSYLAMFRPSEYFGKARESAPVEAKYLFVYPLTKKREWYSIPFEERRRMMRDHVTIGQRYPSVTIHTAYSFGLDDYEFVLSFETDHPQDFLSLVMELRGSEASKFTAIETPIFTCIMTPPRKALDLLGE